MLDSFLKWEENFLVEFVVIEVDHHFRNPRDQASQDLALHRRKVEEAIEHKQLQFASQGRLTAWPSSSPLSIESARN